MFHVLLALPTLAAVSIPAAPAPCFATVADERARAVRDGLCWLARHQGQDGSWSPAAAASVCDSSASIYRPQRPYPGHYDAAVTGLALMALLGELRSSGADARLADPVSGATHDVRAIVQKGVGALLARQQEDGSFSGERTFMYSEAIATQAMCEAYHVLGDESLRAPAQRAADFVAHAQRRTVDGGKQWGWRYAARQEVEDYLASSADQDEMAARELQDSDTSVTSRCTAALRAAANAGLEVRQRHMQGALRFVRFAAQTNQDGQPTGLVGYLDARGAGAKVTGPHDHFEYHPAVMSALAIQIVRDAGLARHELLGPAADQLLRDLPRVTADGLSIDYYYWYNGTRGLARQGGPLAVERDARRWPAWNRGVVDVLLSLQHRAQQDCAHGGWLREDRWTYAHGGPVYTTAFAVLTLQLCE
jgi:hypothetical protein